ncbi:MAG: MBL fold metallo-hydrolase [Bacteroidia bacterium]|nr:MBL fold metallo-hydrolase [Bacteroidales bacterium]NCD41423.1 MBL fold metallo-hydrolase [Bacteroidia bacterium]
MELIPLVTEEWKMDAGPCFGVIPKSLWSKVYPEAGNNLLNICNRLLVVKTENRVVLIDTGYGDKQSGKYYQYKYIYKQKEITKALKEVGIGADEITDVLLTHLHDDHVGGATKREGEKVTEVFPKARYWVSKSQWNWAHHPNKRERAAYFPDNHKRLKESGRITFIEEEGEHLPGIQFRIYDGHTRGQLIPEIGYNDKKIVYMADFIPSSAHIPLVFIAAVDVEPLKVLKEKEAYLKEAAKSKHILFFGHDHYFEACTVEETEKGFVVKERGTLQEMVGQQAISQGSGV